MTSDATISFSVVVPTRDRLATLGRCLDSLSRLDYPRDKYEVVVADDGGAVSPEPAIDSVRGTLDIRLLKLAHAGPAAARNAGAAAAAHPFLAFIDDDCSAHPRWLAELAAALSAEPKRMVGGLIINALTGNPYSSASQSLVSHLYEYFNTDTPRFFCSNNLAAARATFLDVGGFDASFPFAAGEDRDLCDRWHLSGYPMWYTPDAVVYHSHDLDLRRFWRQHVRYGRAAAHYHELFASRRHRHVEVEPARFYLDLVRRPFRSDVAPTSAWTCAGLLLVSQIANASGFIYERYRRRRGQAAVATR